MEQQTFKKESTDTRTHSTEKKREKTQSDLLNEIVEEIRDDALRAPEKYLEESRVPKGGE